MKRLFTLSLLVFLFSCSNDESTSNNNSNPAPNPTPTTYTLGGIGPGGGRIFSLDATGQHGLEVTGVLGQTKWGYSGMSYPQNQTAIAGLYPTFGKGNDNTVKIVTYFGNNNGEPYAAKVCSDLVQNGKDDWYLPSRLELYAIFRFFKIDHPIMDFFDVSERTWSSTQNYTPGDNPLPSHADYVYGIDWVIPMTGGYDHENYYSSSDVLSVRAIRNF
jgi:hypothetical protein